MNKEVLAWVIVAIMAAIFASCFLLGWMVGRRSGACNEEGPVVSPLPNPFLPPCWRASKIPG